MTGEMVGEVVRAPTVRRAVLVRTLLIIRWAAVIGQATTLATVYLALGFALPIADCLALVFASVLVNVYLTLTRSTKTWLVEREAALYLAYDVVQLTALLYLTGGLQNPFAILMLAPVTVSATILGFVSTLLLSLVVVGAITMLGVVHQPLPWIAGEMLDLPDTYIAGVWSALVVATGFIAAYAWRVAAEARGMAEALGATQIALAREQRLSSLGALAAAAAHELGSPLGTIAVVAKELARDLEPGSPLKPDIDLLLSESDRCRAILSELAEAPEPHGGAPFETPLLTALVREIAEHHDSGIVDIEIRTEGAPGSPEPHVRRRPEFVHGLTNLVQNALQFASNRVILTIGWTARGVTIAVEDDGPGFAPSVLARIGEPYISSRAGMSGHMGLGVFIAQTLLGRTGARCSFGNVPGRGARVVIRWKRPEIEAQLEEEQLLP